MVLLLYNFLYIAEHERMLYAGIVIVTSKSVHSCPLHLLLEIRCAEERRTLTRIGTQHNVPADMHH